MEMGELVWLVKGSPIYEALSLSTDGGTTRHYRGYIPEATMGVEVQREEGNDPGPAIHEKIKWSQVLVGGQLVWMRTSLLKPVREAGVDREAG